MQIYILLFQYIHFKLFNMDIYNAYLINISGYKIHNFIKDFLLSLFISIILWISLKYFSVF